MFAGFATFLDRFGDLKVMTVGGRGANNRYEPSAEVYDPTLDRWSNHPSAEIRTHDPGYALKTVPGSLIALPNWRTTPFLLVGPLVDGPFHYNTSDEVAIYGFDERKGWTLIKLVPMNIDTNKIQFILAYNHK